MATDISRLAGNIASDLYALYKTEADPSNENDEDYFIRTLSTIIATRVLQEITGNAKCSGTDSHGDSHDNVGII